MQNIVSRIKELDELNTRITSYLNPELKQYCRIANLKQHRLIIFAANGSIATSLHFEKQHLLIKFKEDHILKKILDIQIKVHPLLANLFSQQTTNKNKKMQPLSQNTAAIIQACADSLSDPKLKEIMEKLARHI